MAIAIVGFFASPHVCDAALLTYSFDSVTNTRATDVAIGEAQLFVDVTDVGVNADQVKFIFRNTGPLASSICDIYFDDGTLLGIFSIVNGPGTAFQVGASPTDLPGGNTVGFTTSSPELRADSNSPVMHSGVNPGEYVEIIVNLINNKVYSDVIAAINLSLANPGVDVTNGLRIGIHVQGFATGGSESFINGPIVPAPGANVPEPATLTLWGIGLTLCGLARWRSRRSVRIATMA